VVLPRFIGLAAIRCYGQFGSARYVAIKVPWLEEGELAALLREEYLRKTGKEVDS